jgi:cytochrome oxidase Cu insertion factor (SCO1/SenC/PrrC family)
MASTPQPSPIAHLVSNFASLVQAHGFAVNLFAVIALGVIGGAFLTGRAALIRPAVIGMTALCLADWVLIEDFGFFGGLGTDPNSMIPMALLAIAGYLAFVKAPAPIMQRTAEPVPAAYTDPASTPPRNWRSRLRPSMVSRSLATASVGTVGSAGAVGLILLGAIPMAAAQANPVASTILARALGGAGASLDSVAPSFTLTDQNGRQISLASLRGKVILLTFLSSRCASTDCHLIAQEFRQAGTLLGDGSRHVELVAVNLNPLNTGVAYTQAFDRREGLAGVPNWLYLTGSLAQLRPVWHSYGIAPDTVPTRSIPSGSNAFVIDPSGRLRQKLDLDPGPGTAATQSSFAAELAGAARHLLSQQ